MIFTNPLVAMTTYALSVYGKLVLAVPNICVISDKVLITSTSLLIYTDVLFVLLDLVVTVYDILSGGCVDLIISKIYMRYSDIHGVLN